MDACDLFARLLAPFAVPENRPDRQLRASWKRDAQFAARVDDIEYIVAGRGSVPEGLAEDIANAIETPTGANAGVRDAFAVLLGIDRAFAGLQPFASDDRDALAVYRDRLWQRHRLDNGAVGTDAVLPRRSRPTRGRIHPEQLEDEFENLIVVRASGLQVVDYAVVDPQYDMTTQEVRATDSLRIACVPFLGSYHELSISDHPFAGGPTRYYSICPKDDAGFWSARIHRVLTKLRNGPVHFAVVPELALSNDLLSEWQASLSSEESGDHRDSPYWLLAGTGGVGHTSNGELPPNRAVLLSRSGASIMEQDKMRPFDLNEGTIVKWKLDPYLAKQNLLEGMKEGRVRRIRDIRAGRIVVLICEDHGRLIDEVAAVASYGPSLIFVPIFSEPIRKFYWEHQNALEEVNAIGAAVIVANSCA